MLLRYGINLDQQARIGTSDTGLGPVLAKSVGGIEHAIMFLNLKLLDWETSYEVSVFQRAQAMVFAIEEINQNPNILPNITLGFQIYDNCNNIAVAHRAGTALFGGVSGTNTASDDNCLGSPPVLAIVGDARSSHSIAISRTMGVFHMPLVSYFATCTCLSAKHEFPSFFRTIPSDAFQVKAIIKILKHYGWVWVGVIATDDDYGQYALKLFIEEFKSFGCLSFVETLPTVYEKAKILLIAETIKKSSANVIIAFAGEEELNYLVNEVVLQNITGRQWIASEAWSTSNFLASSAFYNSFGGTLGIAIRSGEIPGLEQFFLQVRPNLRPENNLVVQFWETMFQCKFQQNLSQENTNSKPCTGSEDIKSMKTAYSETAERSTYTIYKAVYALAHALHNLIKCENGKGPFENNTCADKDNVQPWQLTHYLRKVNFTNHLGERVAFDENGDPLALYDIVNWQRTKDGTVFVKTVGIFDASSRDEEKLTISEDLIFWNSNSLTVPESVCSKSCFPGTRKTTRKGQPVCCFDCVPCADGEISNITDATECIKCPDDLWSNAGKNQCVLKEIEFLTYDESMGVILTIASLFGASISVCILIIFIHHRNTPVVKANNSELSFLLLISLILCFLCSLSFIGQPSDITCRFRHVMFGISFVLCISCILVKTIVVIMAFKATLPGSNIMKLFGVAQQRGTIFFLTFIQSMICCIWLVAAPPFPTKNSKYLNTKIILECDIGSLIAFSCTLGYVGLLSCICFLIAFLARNLPDTFNEAKFITFSMLIFCSVWITFIPAYISSPGKHTVAVEIFAILASSFGVTIAIFAPKCYIILLKPERNTKKALMGRVVS
ncbi:extracellular calcium-sensing receptor-like [Polypterus senegalus]|uniref:extracellular calcium-sensing receptor-like n=1 Tax=Polypterus senegalus TaxID=55291 RepID=UPI0019632C40|nr:extracellular calcium-sensing receptor-like [Polypterus senegalus]